MCYMHVTIMNMNGATSNESNRWKSAILRLKDMGSSGEMPKAQLESIFNILYKVYLAHPNIRLPALGPGEGGDYIISWSYIDHNDNFNVEISNDGFIWWEYDDRTYADYEEGENISERMLELVGRFI